MEWLRELLDNSHWPALTALVLGLMTAISPCTLVTNISAIGFIGKNISDRGGVLLRGAFYTLGLAFTYTGIGLLFYLGLGNTGLSAFFQVWGDKIIGPVLVVTGLILIRAIRWRIPGAGWLAERMERRKPKGIWSAFLLGALFALAFCPYTGVLYFAIMMPLVATSAGGVTLTLLFAAAAGLPVMLFAWLIAYALGTVGRVYDRLRAFERWFRRVVALLMIATGIYFIVVAVVAMVGA